MMMMVTGTGYDDIGGEIDDDDSNSDNNDSKSDNDDDDEGESDDDGESNDDGQSDDDGESDDDGDSDYDEESDGDDLRHRLVIVIDDAEVLGKIDAHVDDLLLYEVDAHGDHSQSWSKNNRCI